MTCPPLIIIGASTRAAAWCASRSGFAPLCIDQFGDRDLRDIAACVRVVDDWPTGIIAALDAFPDAPWMYAGALENSPDLIRDISRTRPLLGCDEHTLRIVRDPSRVTAIWRDAGLPTLPIVVDRSAFQRDTRNDVAARPASPITGESIVADSIWPDGWIWKPYASAAGIGVREWPDIDMVTSPIPSVVDQVTSPALPVVDEVTSPIIPADEVMNPAASSATGHSQTGAHAKAQRRNDQHEKLCSVASLREAQGALARDPNGPTKDSHNATATESALPDMNPMANPLRDGWLQGRASGIAISGLYLAAGCECRMLGLSRQLHGEPAAGATGFLYCGSIGPLSTEDVPETCLKLAAVYGQALIDADCGLTGLFGIDFIWNEPQQRLWPLEVNPRWTASAELYERHHHWPLIRWHVDACMQQQPSDVPTTIDTAVRRISSQASRPRVRGRLVVYARGDSSRPGPITGRDFDQLIRHGPHRLDTGIEVADLPMPDAEIPSGAPLCTLLTTASSSTECHHILLEAAAALRA